MLYTQSNTIQLATERSKNEQRHKVQDKNTTFGAVFMDFSSRQDYS